MKKLLVCLLLAAGCATAPAPAPSSAPPPARPLDAPALAAPFDRAIWSILVEDERGRVLFERNAGTLIIPASNRKLFSSTAVAECLGIDTQLQTEIWRDGEDLVVRGDGDPSLGSWRYERQDDFDDVARRLRALGITSVRDIIADVSAFDRLLIPYGWKYGNIGSDYAAPVDALSWGENEVPVNRAVDDPALHTAAALRDALILHGVEVRGAIRTNVEPRVWQEKLLELPSPFVGELLRTVLKNSHNLYAEMLLKRSGCGTYDDALASERLVLANDPDLDPATFRFVDGSGLAPDNLMTARAAVRLLRWMNDPVRRAYWWDTLAQPANEGTLRRRLVPLEHRLRAKTGTINGVNALSGIITMPDGGTRYFSIAVNHHTGSSTEAVRIIDEMVMDAAERDASGTLGWR